ncbi:MAG: hypothetical protein MUD01_14725 [Chloroflexaceae bacterium]|nr:hypothetical protein [Chloroflexaceae bacterium]
MNPTTNDFTADARRALEEASRHAASRGAAQVEPEHMLLALLEGKAGLVRRTLAELKVDGQRMQQVLLAQVPPPASANGAATPANSPAANQVLSAALKEARHLGHRQVDALHLLLGLLYDSQSRAAQLLNDGGVTLYELRQHVLQGPRRFANRGAGVQLGEILAVVRISPVFLIPLGLLLASGLGLYFNPAELWVTPLTLLFVISGWVVSLCVHEFGHALAAYIGGDSSMRDKGYLSLNPLKYTDWLFSIVLPLIILLMGGIGLPGGAVYVNTLALRSMRWNSIVSAAGPLGTIICGVLLITPFALFDWFNWVTPENINFWPALAYLGFLQITALVFNLIPLPPLDGFGIIAPYLPQGLREQMYRFGNLFFLLLFMLFFIGGPITNEFWNGILTFAMYVGLPIDLVFAGMGRIRP